MHVYCGIITEYNTILDIVTTQYSTEHVLKHVNYEDYTCYHVYYIQDVHSSYFGTRVHPPTHPHTHTHTHILTYIRCILTQRLVTTALSDTHHDRGFPTFIRPDSPSGASRDCVSNPDSRILLSGQLSVSSGRATLSADKDMSSCSQTRLPRDVFTCAESAKIGVKGQIGIPGSTHSNEASGGETDYVRNVRGGGRAQREGKRFLVRCAPSLKKMV